ncbi:CRISPR-associated endoribonuclease Cas6 [Phytohabitans flavus]|uniref:CRISPR-associated endoribonuclease Cas6 n=1 Tax=Phytohabitans flavus TaxID=1076124 RepID=A0A6F8XLB4_9ACTN|nr:CRISPR system precrRNA processing endoribonuclease RAMP protein Cas6 [Phytohabitans flavus]BCB74579.1 CRISPR-associated endoribonuclease Cas6 [Phytohabitans flavus]
MPSRWRLLLPGIDPATVRLEHLHAVVCRWLDDSDEAHRAQTKPYSVSPPIAATGGTAVEIGLLTEPPADRLCQQAQAGTRVRLGSSWSTLHTAPQQVTAESWQALADISDTNGDQAWCLRFLTPTTFRRGNSFTPAPTLPAILGSLRRSWRDFAPPDLPPLVLDLSADPVWLTDIDVASQTVRVNDRVISGFTGRLRFVCDTDSQAAASVERLVRLAAYAGIGAHTTRGFGLNRREPTWTPAPSRRPQARRPVPQG